MKPSLCDPESLRVQVIPSEEVRMYGPQLLSGLPPTVTNVSFPYVIPYKLFDVTVVLSVHFVPYDEVKIDPDVPTETK